MLTGWSNCIITEEAIKVMKYDIFGIGNVWSTTFQLTNCRSHQVNVTTVNVVHLPLEGFGDAYFYVGILWSTEAVLATCCPSPSHPAMIYIGLAQWESIAWPMAFYTAVMYLLIYLYNICVYFKELCNNTVQNGQLCEMLHNPVGPHRLQWKVDFIA